VQVRAAAPAARLDARRSSQRRADVHHGQVFGACGSPPGCGCSRCSRSAVDVLCQAAHTYCACRTAQKDFLAQACPEKTFREREAGASAQTHGWHKRLCIKPSPSPSQGILCCRPVPAAWRGMHALGHPAGLNCCACAPSQHRAGGAAARTQLHEVDQLWQAGRRRREQHDGAAAWRTSARCCGQHGRRTAAPGRRL